MITPTYNRGQKQGFALIATISVMVLLVMIALAMLSLSTIEMRASRNNSAMVNARMALMLAIGELQQHAGQDQRVTANADIISTGDVPQSQILGVWDSIGVNPSGANLTNTKDLNALANAYKNSYANKKRGDRFRKWLISGDQTSVQDDIDFPKLAASSNTIPLVGAHTLGASNEASLSPELRRKLIKAERLDIKNGATTKGRYAWAVTGENLKARVNLTAPTGIGGDSERMVQRAGSSINAIQVMNDTSVSFGAKFMDASGELSPGLDKVTSVQSLRLAGHSAVDEAALGAFYSDLSISSSGLLTDAKWGGWKKDLSLLAESTSLPTKLALSADSTAQVFEGVATGTTPEEITRAHGPYWEDLWSYLRSYKPFTEGGLVEWNGSSPYYSVGPDWNSAVTRRGWQMRMPVLSKYMWMISFSGDAVTIPTSGTRLNLIAQPIIELWNPFSLPLKMPTDSKFNFELVTLPVFMTPEYQDGTPVLTTSTAGLVGRSLSNVLKANSSGSAAIYSVDFNAELAMQPGENTLYSDQNATPQTSSTGKFILTKGLSVQGGVKYERIGHGRTPVVVPDTSKAIGVDYTYDPSKVFHSRSYFSDQSGVSGSMHSQLLHSGDRHAIVRPLPIKGGYFNLSTTATTPSLIYGAVMMTEIPISVSEPADSVDELTESELVKFSHHLYGALSNGRSFIGPHGGNNGIPEMLETSAFAYFGRRVSSYSNLPISLSGTDNGLQGREVGATGQTHMPTRELPIQPLTSMAQLQHANLGGYHIAWDFNTTTTAQLENSHLVSHPHVSFAFGNSYASHFVAADEIEFLCDSDNNHRSPMGQRRKTGTNSTDTIGERGYITTLHDKCWKANEALWDEWFLSGVGDWTNPLVPAALRRDKFTIINDFTTLDKPLPNARYTPDVDDSVTAETTINRNDGYTKLARYISSQGSFNVNSTSKFAWKAVLGGLDRQTADLIYLDKLSGSIENDSDSTNEDGYAFSRFTLPNGQSTASTGTSAADRQGRYLGARKLSDTELDLLADKIVAEVKLRGPFLSLSEFMNRRLASGTDDLAKRGALQAAIDKARLNQGVEGDSSSIPVSDVLGTYANSEALKSYDGTNYNGPLYTVTGAPSHLSQADVLMSIAPSLTVRCDTFTIRAYGESLDSQGKVSARAWCEAVVKRQPEYIDPSDAADKQVVDLDGDIATLSTTNQQHGRRMKIVSFRWLSQDEI